MRKWMVVAATALGLSALVAAPTADGATVTLGSPGPASSGTISILALFSGSIPTIVPNAIPGATVTSPGNGVITSWKIANATGGPFTLQVVHPSGSTFASTASSAPAAVTDTGTLTFPTDLPIAKGDYIGVVPGSAGDHIGAAGSAGATFNYFTPPLGASPRPANGNLNAEVGFNAEVLLDCIVPKLKGKKVGAARKALGNAGCAAPKVKKKGGKVVRKQSPAQGTEIRGDAVVTLKAGRKK